MRFRQGNEIGGQNKNTLQKTSIMICIKATNFDDVEKGFSWTWLLYGRSQAVIEEARKYVPEEEN